MDILLLIRDLGPAAASVTVTWMFLQFLTQERKSNSKERADNRLELSNHLSGTVRVLQQMLDSQEEHRKNTEK
jgi:hypothetical protein